MTDPFLGRYAHSLDSKGRVAVPAGIRSAVWRKENPGIVLFFDIDPAAPFVHGTGSEAYRDIAARFAVTLPGPAVSRRAGDAEARPALANPFARRNQVLGRGQWSRAEFLSFDKEGRVVLPAAVVRQCGLTDSVSFVGCGNTFQVWDPETLEREDRRDREVLEQYRTMMEGFDDWQVDTVAVEPVEADGLP